MLESGPFTLCRTGCKAVADFPTCVMSSSQGQRFFTCYANVCPVPLPHTEVTHVDLASWLRNAALNTDSPSRVGAEAQLLKQAVAGRQEPQRGHENPDPVSGRATSCAVRTLAKSLHLLGQVSSSSINQDGEGGQQLPSLPQKECACTSFSDSCGGSEKCKHTNIRPSFIINVLVIE